MTPASNTPSEPESVFSTEPPTRDWSVDANKPPMDVDWVLAQDPVTGKWHPDEPLPEPRIWKLWRWLRLMK